MSPIRINQIHIVHVGRKINTNPSIYLKDKIGQGITIQQFMETMHTREMILSGIPDTKARFTGVYEQFQWQKGENLNFFTALQEHHRLHVLILCTDWCPDVIWNVPVLFRLMEQSGIPAEILLMEEHLETMDLFLTAGGRAQPVALFLNACSGQVLGRWGARPAYIQAVMDQFKCDNPDNEADEYRTRLNDTYRQIGRLYNEGTFHQTVIIQEVKALLQTIAASGIEP